MSSVALPALALSPVAFAPVDGAVDVASAAVSAIAAVVTPLAGGTATALAIVLFTVAVRLTIAPLTVARVRGERRRAALAPQTAELRRRYAGQPERLAAELLALHRSAGVRPFAGILPTLLQAPFFLVMYRLFTTSPAGGPLDGQLLGVPLRQHLIDGPSGAATPVFGILLLILATLAWWTARRIRRQAVTAARAGVGAEVSASSGSTGGDGVPRAAVLARVMPLLSYAVLPMALVLPLAGVLYLVTTTICTALEQVLLHRPV